MGIFNKGANDFEAPTSAIDDLSGDWTIDPAHTRIGFSARHAMVTTVRGRFTEFEGTAHIDTATPANSKVSLTIKGESVDTSNADRDAHLRSGDFFENEAHPDITFVSTNVERDGEDWVVTGDLSIKGVTREVTLDVSSEGFVPSESLSQRLIFREQCT